MTCGEGEAVTASQELCFPRKVTRHRFARSSLYGSETATDSLVRNRTKAQW
jgi:hypothetical protein